MKKKYFSDFHTNMHSKHINEEMDMWYDFAKENLDFWAPVYYPYYANSNEKGFIFEDTHALKKYELDYKVLNDYLTNKTDGFITYPAYEWQGSGADGDHNVFSLEYNNKMEMPLTYEELVDSYKNQEVIGIPHHTAYYPLHRGKNWKTHNEKFSPVTEVYSSHGSSEESSTFIPLNVHIHMGPRSDQGSAYEALKQGIKVGFIASGDNHICPAISGNGLFAVVADSYDRETIFNAIRNRNTYGVSRNKMNIDFTINDEIMGSETKALDKNIVKINCVSGSAIDRVELYQNGLVKKVYTHSGTYERNVYTGKVKFKFELEIGWGPDRRIFKEISEKSWDVKLNTKGEILSVEKLFTSPGCKILKEEKQNFEASIISKKDLPGQSKLSQKNYMTPNIQNQSLIFEIEDDINSNFDIIIDGKTYNYKIKDLLYTSDIICLEEEIKEMLSSQCDFDEYYREDPWWHNAYKVVVHKGFTSDAYTFSIEDEITDFEKVEDNYFAKIIQKNGEVGWTSPIYIKK